MAQPWLEPSHPPRTCLFHLEDEAAQDTAQGGRSASEEDDRGGREVGDEDEDVLVQPVPHAVQAVLYDIGVIQQREGQPCLKTKKRTETMKLKRNMQI